MQRNFHGSLPKRPCRFAGFKSACIIIPAVFSLARLHAADTEWRVGPARALTLPSQAAAVAKDGDTVTIDAGAYVDCATWTQNNLLIRGAGSGFAHVRDKCCGGKAIWVIQGRNTTVWNIEFSGAAVPDKNGAGIRQEGEDLYVVDCYFHDNENGILTGANKNSEIRIETSVFDRNGYGDGYSHNMYIGHVGSFTLLGCWTHRAKVGHNVKSRADTTRLLYNRISNESDGTASRDVDVPNGGYTLILGNEIQHGARTQNSNVIGYGMEGLSNPSRVLMAASNTVVQERGAGTFIQLPSTGTDSLLLYNNLFVGAGAMISGTAAHVDSQANLLIRAITDAGFADHAAYNYYLTGASPAVNAGVLPPDMLKPAMEYIHPASYISLPWRRSDVGAHESGLPDGAENLIHIAATRPEIGAVHPNPCSVFTDVTYTIHAAGPASLHLYTLLGAEAARLAVGEHAAGTHAVRCTTTALARGMYVLRLVTAQGASARLVAVE